MGMRTKCDKSWKRQCEHTVKMWGMRSTLQWERKLSGTLSSVFCVVPIKRRGWGPARAAGSWRSNLSGTFVWYQVRSHPSACPSIRGRQNPPGPDAVSCSFPSPSLPAWEQALWSEASQVTTFTAAWPFLFYLGCCHISPSPVKSRPFSAQKVENHGL